MNSLSIAFHSMSHFRARSGRRHRSRSDAVEALVAMTADHGPSQTAELAELGAIYGLESGDVLESRLRRGRHGIKPQQTQTSEA